MTLNKETEDALSEHLLNINILFQFDKSKINVTIMEIFSYFWSNVFCLSF